MQIRLHNRHQGTPRFDVQNEFEDSKVNVVTPTPYGPLTRNGNDIAASLNLEPDEFWLAFLSLGSLLIGSHIAAYICLKIYGSRV